MVLWLNWPRVTVAVLAPSTSECDLTRRQTFCRDQSKIRSSGGSYRNTTVLVHGGDLDTDPHGRGATRTKVEAEGRAVLLQAEEHGALPENHRQLGGGSGELGPDPRPQPQKEPALPAQ